MSCREFELKMADHVTERLPDAEAAVVAAHVATCEACRGYGDRIRALYAVVLDEEAPRPRLRRVDFAAPRRDRWRVWWKATAALAASLLVLALLLVEFGPGSRPPEDPDAPARLERIELDVPTVPARYAATGWIADRAVARRQAAYTGKTMISVYRLRGCPISGSMWSRLATDRGVALVRDLVAHDAVFTSRPPQDLGKLDPTEPLPTLMPAIVLTSGEETSPPFFSIESLDRVESCLEYWSRLRKDRRRPLSAEQFRRCRDTFEHVESRLGKFAYESLLDALDTIIALGREHRSRFIDDARALKNTLVERLRAQIASIARDLEAGGERRAEARARAKVLKKKLGTTELGRDLGAVLDSRRSRR
jgi:hypothetical protein